MRLVLAIVSITLFIPLLAIGVGSMTALASLVTPSVAVTVGLIIVALVVVTVVSVNLLFNYDLLRSRR
jgi:Kef-type K+ transport system membrane component KefB